MSKSFFSLYQGNQNKELSSNKELEPSIKTGIIVVEKSSFLYKFLSLHPMNKDNEEVFRILPCIPRIPGLKSRKKRIQFAFELIENMKNLKK